MRNLSDNQKTEPQQFQIEPRRDLCFTNTLDLLCMSLLLCPSPHFFVRTGTFGTGKHTSTYVHVCSSTRVPLRACLCAHPPVCLSGAQQVKPGRRSCWPARSIGLARKDRPMRPTSPPRTAAASLPSFTLSASTCSVPSW